jgi:hypothetical protein
LKISAVRRRDFSCCRRAIPPLNDLKQERKSVAADERVLMGKLLTDDETRRRIRARYGEVGHPTSVWNDCDQTWDHTNLVSYELPEWRDLSERMKMFLGFDLGMELGWCFSFTANLSPRFLEKWESNGSGFMANIDQRLRRELKKLDLGKLPFCYVVETRTRSGKSRCKPHLHGIAICDDPLKATKLKVALERAFAGDLKRDRQRRAVKVDRGYSCWNLGVEGRVRWVEYITKNVHLYDERLGSRRVYISHSYNALACKAWAIRREEFALESSVRAVALFEYGRG